MREAPFTEEAARAAIDGAVCWSDALRTLGYRPVGHNIRTLQRHARTWGISTDHFDPDIGRRRAGQRRRVPLDQVLVQDSKYSRGHLKQRLYAAGLKERRCEMCGQTERWRNHTMSLVLDHINGVADDHRLENLRILCPNCAATLDTHCGRNLPRKRECAGCGRPFAPQTIHHRYCSRSCPPGQSPGIPRPERRKVERPAFDRLLAEVEADGFMATGRRYGVSDNAIRKWIRQYEREAAAQQDVATPSGDGDSI